MPTAVAVLACVMLAACAGGDETFGVGGKVVTDIEHRDALSGMAFDGDGKIVVTGSTSRADGMSGDFVLARYTSDGRLDETFGRAGKIITDFGEAGVPAAVDLDGDDHASGVVVQADGKIVVAGSSDDAFALARYDEDGSLDLDFGTGGKVVTDLGGGVGAIAVQADGKIVVAGGGLGFALARYLADGTLDPSFGTDGTVLTEFAGDEVGASALAIQDDGRIVVAGSGLFEPDFAVARYTPEGSLDSTFGVRGTVTTAFGTEREDFAAAVAIQADGKIVVSGSSGVDVEAAPYDFALVRYTSYGRLDTSFGESGKVLTNFGGRRSYDGASALSIQEDGRIVAAGYSSVREEPSDLTLARYTADGRLDESFGTAGRVRSDLGRDESASAVAVLPDGAIVAAGTAGSGTSSDFFLVRYTADGRLDS